MLSQTAEYALRAMACLAQNQGGYINSEALACGAKIPAHYVSKVMRQLVVADLVSARRGRRGGFALSREPANITYAQILSAVGSAPDTDRCGFGHDQCDLNNPCPLHPTWTKLQSSLASWANSTTLAEILPGDVLANCLD